jgi:predicted ATP-dependent protease
MDPTHFAVPVEKLRWRCDAARLNFSCTHEITAPATFIGQERAVSALEFGLGLDRPGYNIFVTGLPGTGKSTVVQSHIREAIRTRTEKNGPPEVYDWCYVFNFERTDSPEAIQLPRGQGASLVRDVDSLLETLRREVQAAYNDDAYKTEVKLLTEASVTRRRDLMLATERAAEQRGFAIQAGPAGIMVFPLVDGKPLDQAQYKAMSERERAALDTARREVSAQVEEAVHRIQALEQEHSDAMRDLDRRVAEHTVDGPFRKVMAVYSHSEDARMFLDGLRKYTLESIKSLRGEDEEEDSRPSSAMRGPTSRLSDPLLPYRVNLFVDNSRTEGPPIIVEDNPTYSRLFGQIERRATMGTYITDHTMLKPGSLVLASGGYLVLDAREVLSHVAVWPALKRVLKGGAVRPEDPADVVLPGVFPQGLRPEAVPIKVKIILSGDPVLYDLLSSLDPDFWEIFKVHSDLDFRMPLTAERINDYARFICGTCNARKLRHFSADGVAAVVEYGARLVSDQRRLSTRFGLLVDVLVEASHWAEQDGEPMAGRRHVEKALEQKVYRSSRIADAIQEMMLEGSLMVSLEGAVTGQANGLAVYSTGDIAFGKPGRITAVSSVGRGAVVNIEREANLSGQTHDKGVLILGGYLASRFAQDHPLSVTISVAFEQSYGMIDGDSASSTELYAILSSLAGIPIRQDIAVTGSVNQRGEVQPIGGVNEKAEGFYDLCKAAGRLGSTGVMVPASNVHNLMLKPEIVEAVRAGRFHVYAVHTIDEGLEILTGKPAGERDADGAFPPDSVNGRVQARLRGYADRIREYGPQAAH